MHQKLRTLSRLSHSDDDAAY